MWHYDGLWTLKSGAGCRTEPGGMLMRDSRSWRGVSIGDPGSRGRPGITVTAQITPPINTVMEAAREITVTA